jgi:hypothetical protein
MRTARVRCCIRGCKNAESIAFDDAGVTGRSQVEAFAQAAEAAGWGIGTETLPTGEVIARDRCPEHRLAPPVAEIAGVTI